MKSHEQLGNLTTETRNPASMDIDKKTTLEMLQIINDEDKTVAFAVEKVLPDVAQAIELIVPRLKSGGRLFYVGAGTSGRLGVVDASECPPTFGTPPELVQGIIAGGKEAIFRSREGAEDDELTLEQISFVTSDEAFLKMRTTSESVKTAIYISRDAGNTWTLTPTLIPGAGSADFLSADEAILYNGGQFHVTRDAARTWSLIPPDVVFGDTFAGMDFVNTSTGWVITLDPTNHRSLYRTSDGGATWFPVVP